MSIRILEDTKSGGKSALYCSTTNFAFGPLFDSLEDAENFLDWVSKTHITDLRVCKDQRLTSLVEEWKSNK